MQGSAMTGQVARSTTSQGQFPYHYAVTTPLAAEIGMGECSL